MARRIPSGCKHTIADILRLYVERPDCGDGCWLWKGPVTAGYSKAWFDGRSITGHRLMYTQFIAPVPRSLQLDHLCRNRLCVNPTHLEPVTSRENNLRNPRSMLSINSAKTRCLNGHALAGPNLYVDPRGRRQCKTCRRNAVYRYEKRLEVGVNSFGPHS